jgi:hypothetical protein
MKLVLHGKTVKVPPTAVYK